MSPLRLLAPVLAALAGPVAAAPADAASAPSLDSAARDAFIAEVAQTHQLSPEAIGAVLAQAQYRQSIIDAITRPAEAKPWKDYRPIFLTPKRIADGRAFLSEHRAALTKVEAETGVPAEVIVAIIGVETSYGRITGNYRVLDALYTLGFFYPKRADFFRSELAQLFALAREESLPITELQGSYAGAMGWGQFMPSSYRAYARDGDGDGRRDLFADLDDVFASIANYFVAHGWQRGEPVTVRARRAEGVADFTPENHEPSFRLLELAEKGYRPSQAIGHDLPASLVTLEGDYCPEHWIVFKNFYVITRYNRSPLYAMAVWQLAQALSSPEDVAPAAVAAPAAESGAP